MNGGTFQGTTSNCIGSTCDLVFSETAVINQIGQQLCMSFLDGDIVVMALELNYLSKYYDLSYVISYYTGDIQIPTQAVIHCPATAFCPDECEPTYDNRYNNGVFTDPELQMTVGTNTCFRKVLPSGCFFFNTPGCYFCATKIIPTGAPETVYKYVSSSVTKALFSFKASVGNSDEYGQIELTSNIPNQFCSGGICVTITLTLSDAYSEISELEYVMYPSLYFGNSEIFSTANLPMKNKFGVVQSNSPAPWLESSSWSQIIYDQEMIITHPGCEYTIAQSPFNFNRPTLPKFVGLQFVDINYTLQENFLGLRVFVPNSTEATLTIAGTGTITRTYETCTFSITNFEVYGCCDCPNGAILEFDATLSSPTCLGYVNANSFDFFNPSFKDGHNSLKFLTNDCSGEKDVHFNTDSMNYVYSVSYELNEVHISSFIGLHYSTVIQSSVREGNKDGYKEGISSFFKDLFTFNGGTATIIFGVIIYAIIVIIIITVMCFIGTALISIIKKLKTN